MYTETRWTSKRIAYKCIRMSNLKVTDRFGSLLIVDENGDVYSSCQRTEEGSVMNYVLCPGCICRDQWRPLEEKREASARSVPEDGRPL